MPKLYLDLNGDHLQFCLDNNINITAKPKQVTVSHELFSAHERYDHHGGDRRDSIVAALIKLVDQINMARDPNRDPRIGVFAKAVQS